MTSGDGARENDLRALPLHDRLAISIYRAVGPGLLLHTRPTAALFRIAYDSYKRITDRGVVTLIRRRSAPGDTIVDVGAHLGFFTVRMARAVGPSGRVIAYEPERGSAQILKDRLSKERLNNVVLREVALGDRQGVADLYLGRYPADSRTYQHHGATSAYPVDVSTLSREVERFGSMPSLVKMDVQGSELRILRGMDDLLRNPGLRTLVVEFWPTGLWQAQEDPRDVFRMAERNDLQVGLITSRGDIQPAVFEDIMARCRRRGYVDLAFARD